MSFKPLQNYVLLKTIEKPDTTPSGILLPENSRERPNQAIVLEVGAGQIDVNGNLIPMSVKVGDTVLFSKYSGTEIELNRKKGAKEKFLIMRETDLFGIIDESES